ncbi:MAG: hypothetical protein DRP15_03570 [Candidatus Aenigmatarchaeota archaeon]|nr:MAG: hypothetical protein DRP15_03570 [Candidatus Aenigmarchaeota archaeon]
MWLFKKEKQQTETRPNIIPVERVITLSSQGMSEPEIIETLKKEGYTPYQVDAALKQALKNTVNVTPTPPSPPRTQEPLAEFKKPEPEIKPEPSPVGVKKPSEGFIGPDTSKPPIEPPIGFEEFERLRSQTERETPRPEFESPVEPAAPLGFEDEELKPLPKLVKKSDKESIKEERRRMIEELVETIVEDKWKEFTTRFSDFEDRLGDVENKISSLEKRLKDIEEGRSAEFQDIENKIDSYKQNIAEMSAKMSSLEKAMKDTLTPMLQTMRSLSDAVKSLKKK